MNLQLPEKIPLTVLVATKNEEANIKRCLTALSPAAKIIVLDSHSSDATIKIAESFGVEVIQFDYNGAYPKKRQWALDNIRLETEWILLLDADEVVPKELWREISATLCTKSPTVAYLITKGFHFLGKPFRFGGFSHSAVLLFKHGKAKFEHIMDEKSSAPDMEIHERLIVDGPIGRLRTALIHEDFKGLEAYVERHNYYSTWEANVRFKFLREGTWGNNSVKAKWAGNVQERRRFLKGIAAKIPFEPWLWFFYHFLFKFGFLEGRRGLIACQIRRNYIEQVRAKLFEIRLKKEIGT